MPSFRDIKRRARADLHRHMQVRALYLVQGASPLDVTVRVHTSFKALGDQQGTGIRAADREEAVPQIIFLRSEVPAPSRHAIVSVEPGEAYRIDHSDPPDDLTVKAYVTRVSLMQTAGLPVPTDD